MRRRDFITLLSGAATWPLAARAQQPGRVFRVGWFFSSTPLAQMAGPDPIIPVGKALVQGLRALGYVEGHNLVLERRSAEGKFERIPEIAAELVSRNPDVIITGSGNRLAQELQRITKSVPIVMPDSDDPVGAGLVESLGSWPRRHHHRCRPWGGNSSATPRLRSVCPIDGKMLVRQQWLNLGVAQKLDHELGKHLAVLQPVAVLREHGRVPHRVVG